MLLGFIAIFDIILRWSGCGPACVPPRTVLLQPVLAVRPGHPATLLKPADPLHATPPCTLLACRAPHINVTAAQMAAPKLALALIAALAAAAATHARILPAAGGRGATQCDCDGLRRFEPCCGSGSGWLPRYPQSAPSQHLPAPTQQQQEPPEPPRLQGCFAPRQGVRVVVGTTIPCCPNAAAPCPSAANAQTGTSECVTHETWRVVQVRTLGQDPKQHRYAAREARHHAASVQRGKHGPLHACHCGDAWGAPDCTGAVVPGPELCSRPSSHRPHSAPPTPSSRAPALRPTFLQLARPAHSSSPRPINRLIG
jgi:hypothetical protein